MAVLERKEARGSEPIYELSAERHVKIPMRDGVLLDATIWRPRDEGVYPVIVERVPYELIARCSGYADYFARRGYVFVGQNLRGTFASQGQAGPPPSVGEDWDGYDTIEWVGTQPWSTGKVGMVDGSASGFTQYSVAPMRPPHLAALFIRESGHDPYRMWFRGGAFRLALSLGVSVRARGDSLVEDEARWQRFLPLKACPPVLERASGARHLRALDHPDDGPYWWPRALSRHLGEIDVPIFHLGGWHDMFPAVQLSYFAGIRAQGRSATCRQSQKLVIGPWEHYPLCAYLRRAGDVDFGPEGVVDLNALRVRWYDYWLKGIDNGIMDEAPARVFVMGASRWLDLDNWPPEDIDYTPVYLRAGTGPTTGSLNSGGLSWEAPQAAGGSDRFAYDPEDPVPSLVG